MPPGRWRGDARHRVCSSIRCRSSGGSTPGAGSPPRSTRMKLKHVMLLAFLLVSTVLLTQRVAAQQGTIKIGILHSLSGTMAISETTLKDTVLMLIQEQNRKGGLLGRKLEAVVVDPASDWPRFAEKAR